MMKVKARRRSNVTMKRSPMKGHRPSPMKKRGLSRLAQQSGIDIGDDNGAEAIGTAAAAGPVPANIRVAVRVRPENERELANSQHRNIIDVVDERMLVFDPKECNDDFYFHGQKQQRRDLNKKANRDQKFAFDCVFGPNSTNEDVFEGTTKDLVDVIFNGYNCSVFVYGATGAGKTHTMLGSDSNTGIIFRTVMELYSRIEQVKQDSDCEVVVSYLEVYNETVIDLINPGTKLDIREDGKMGVNIPGLSSHRPSGPDDLLRLLQYGNGNRSQHPTDANKESSRSHAVFQVYIKQTNRDSGLSADVKVAKLSMIDLAGSERGSATSSRGAARFREGANINKSLLALGNCINALAEGSKYIPYRNSKLTRLLKDSIGGNCRTVMISNISPSSLTYEDTFNTLKYADRAKKIKIKLKKNILSVDFQVSQYAKIVEDLKSQLGALKAKIVALEEENSALKNQVEMDDQLRKEQSVISVNNDELKALRDQLSSLEERQKDYDDLQKRIAEFEAKERLQKMEAEVNNSSVVEKNDKLQETIIGPYLQTLSKFYQFEGQIRLLKLKQENYQHSLMRARILSLDDEENEANRFRLAKFVKDLDKKMQRLKKKQSSTELSLKVMETEVPMKDADFLHQVQSLKMEQQSEHALKVNEFMFHEQAKTEELFRDAMSQLKMLYLKSYAAQSLTMDPETRRAFEGLLSKVACQTIQFRDHKITEDNEESNFDRLGSFYSNIVNLDQPMEVNYCNMNETMGVEKANETELIVTVEPMDVGENDEENPDEEEISPVRWRPPTPPRVDSSSAENTPVSPKKLDFGKGELTPTFPELKTIETKQLFRAPIHTLDCTYDLSETKEVPTDDVKNATFGIDHQNELQANENLEETFEAKSEKMRLFDVPEIKDEPEKAAHESAESNVLQQQSMFSSLSTHEDAYVNSDDARKKDAFQGAVDAPFLGKQAMFDKPLSPHEVSSKDETFDDADAPDSIKHNNDTLSISGVEPFDHVPLMESTTVISSQDHQERPGLNSTIVICKEEPTAPPAPAMMFAPTQMSRNTASPKVAKVSPMVPEKPKNKLPSSAPIVDRRAKTLMQQGSLHRPGMKRQPGVKSTSNLLKALENMGPKPKPVHEAPAELFSSDSNLSTPSYLKPTSASVRKFGGAQAGTPNSQHQPASGSNENMGLIKNPQRPTGAYPKQNRAPVRKDPVASTLKPLNK